MKIKKNTALRAAGRSPSTGVNNNTKLAGLKTQTYLKCLVETHLTSEGRSQDNTKTSFKQKGFEIMELL
jgi:hypothetical protein